MSNIVPIATSKRWAASRKDLTAVVQELGFTEYEARAYVALCKSSPATAYQVAKAAGLPLPNSYKVLAALEKKGAIQAVMEEPVRYVPLDPEEFFDRLAKTTAGLCAAAAREAKQQSAGPEQPINVWTYRGEPNVNAKIRDLILAAKNHVWIKAAASRIEPLVPDLLAAASRGIEIRLMEFGDTALAPIRHPNVQVFLHEGTGRGTLTSDVLFTVTSDMTHVLSASFADEAFASYSQSPTFVFVVHSMILHEIYLSEIYARNQALIERQFGKGLAKLRKKHRPKNMERRLRAEGGD